jgi:hypothetical protein
MKSMMHENYLAGLFLAISLFLLTKKYNMLDSPEFYFSILVAVTTYYIAFAFEHEKHIIIEIAGSAIFSVLGLLFLRKSMVVLACLIISHGIYDYFHLAFLNDSGTPAWWPEFCATFDIVFGSLLLMHIETMKKSRMNSDLK